MSESELPNPSPGGDEGLAPAQDEDADIVFSQIDDEPEASAASEVDAAAPPQEPTQDQPAQAPEPQISEHNPATAAPSRSGDGLNAVLQIPIVVEIVLGSARMTVSELAALGKGSKIPLDRKVGEPVDVVVNGRIIAHGSVVMLDDGTDRFGINLESIAGPEGQSTQGAVRSA